MRNIRSDRMLILPKLFHGFVEGKEFAADAFVVGGTVRDMLLNRDVKDVDIAVKGDALDIGRFFADSVGGSFIVLDEDFGIARVAKDHEFIDICTMRGASITDDLTDRDITINAMAIPVPAMEGMTISIDSIAEIIIDPFNGLTDLKYGIIRMVSESNLVKDPLRLLRVYRFSATLHFQIEIHTSAAVKTHAALISNAAVERIAEELRHILKVDDSYSAIKEIEKDGLLLHLFPQLREFSIETWNHCRQSFSYAEHILRNLPLYFPGRNKPIWDYFAEGYRLVCLKLSLLLQDEEIAGEVTSGFRLSRKETEFVRMILSNSEVVKTLNSDEKSATISFLHNFGDDIYTLLIYALASTHVCQLSENPLVSLTREIVSIYQDEFIPRQKRLHFINGYDLIEEFRLSPSPSFKEILSAVELLALEGVVNSREEALKAAEEIIREKGLRPN